MISTKTKDLISQDISYIQRRIVQVNAELNNLLLEPKKNAKRITKTRGNLILLRKREINLTKDEKLEKALKKLLYFELAKHKQQLTERIEDNKKSKKSKLSTEMALKIKRTVAAYKQIPTSYNKNTKVNSIMDSVDNTVSVAGTAVKLPLLITNKVVKAGAILAAKVITLPPKIVGYFVTRIIDPDSIYNHKVINKMSYGLENSVKKIMEAQEKAIRRI